MGGELFIIVDFWVDVFGIILYFFIGICLIGVDFIYSVVNVDGKFGFGSWFFKICYGFY